MTEKYHFVAKCSTCNGRGEDWNETCLSCGGSGKQCGACGGMVVFGDEFDGYECLVCDTRGAR